MMDLAFGRPGPFFVGLMSALVADTSSTGVILDFFLGDATSSFVLFAPSGLLPADKIGCGTFLAEQGSLSGLPCAFSRMDCLLATLCDRGRSS
jgi:hypothetical protein